jgi:PAS domain-containing protein
MRRGNFIGYRGFGVCRDFDAIARLAALRLAELSGEMVTPQEPSAAPPAEPASVASPSSDELPEPIAANTSAAETSHQKDLETPVEPPKETVEESVPEIVSESVQEIAKDALTETATALPADAAANVLPFRAPGETKQPSLTPVENSAFDELARQLSARLDTENGNEAIFDPLAEPAAREAARATPEWLAPPEPPARGEMARDKALLDLLPVGILIYRLDRLLYANPAFLTQMGYPSLHALEDAGGLDALYVEPACQTPPRRRTPASR